MNITIIGCGYVGLVTGVCFAEIGHHVLCVDIDPKKIDLLQKGMSPIHEPGLAALLQKNIENGRLSFTTNYSLAIEKSTLLFIAVGTPADKDGSADLGYVLEVADNIGQYLKQDALIVTKSTVPVGSATKINNVIGHQLKKRSLSIKVDVASNPEFLREGEAIRDFMNPDRVIIGVSSAQAAQTLRLLYQPMQLPAERILIMDIAAAELTKYGSNAFLAAKISFMNELSGLAESLGVDIEQVKQGIGSDHRIGMHFINPGCGFGGSCFPKDVQALAKLYTDNHLPAQMLNAVLTINENQKNVLVKKVKKYFNHDLKDKTIALWGLAFKPNTDDIREASSLTFINEMLRMGAKIRAYDPVAMNNIDEVYRTEDNIRLCATAEEALHNSYILVVVTEWSEFREFNLQLIADNLKERTIFDGRNIFNPQELTQLGIQYFAIGRTNVFDTAHVQKELLLENITH